MSGILDNVLTINGKPYVRFEILSLDVWGNKRDGYDYYVHCTGEYITLPAEFTARDVVLALKGASVLKRNVRHTSVAVDGSWQDYLCVSDSRTGEPVVNLIQV